MPNAKKIFNAVSKETAYTDWKPIKYSSIPCASYPSKVKIEGYEVTKFENDVFRVQRISSNNKDDDVRVRNHPHSNLTASFSERTRSSKPLPLLPLDSNDLLSEPLPSLPFDSSFNHHPLRPDYLLVSPFDPNYTIPLSISLNAVEDGTHEANIGFSTSIAQTTLTRTQRIPKHMRRQRQHNDEITSSEPIAHRSSSSTYYAMTESETIASSWSSCNSIKPSNRTSSSRRRPSGPRPMPCRSIPSIDRQGFQRGTSWSSSIDSYQGAQTLVCPMDFRYKAKAQVVKILAGLRRPFSKSTKPRVMLHGNDPASHSFRYPIAGSSVESCSLKNGTWNFLESDALIDFNVQSAGDPPSPWFDEGTTSVCLSTPIHSRRYYRRNYPSRSQVALTSSELSRTHPVSYVTNYNHGATTINTYRTHKPSTLIGRFNPIRLRNIRMPLQDKLLSLTPTSQNVGTSPTRTPLNIPGIRVFSPESKLIWSSEPKIESRARRIIERPDIIKCRSKNK
ncbi:hypothetical protein M422DRAFT_252740 [Sphaerobolus stellatus SS14]|uniref:Uncharacterized protein n=1 Tax=Sphaerobolus stellatus (strain SS14) TaxID=990650 RepID=A0A0C9VA37_SPHS4|nr:hypothetical protein M422DRAFT_252740 [Sphaerobolus stellatus SS14]